MTHTAIRAPAPAAPWMINVGIAVAVAVAYFLAARLSLALLGKSDGVAVFWPAAGVASGVLIVAGAAVRWPIIAGVMIATVVANLLGDRNLWSSAFFAVANAAEAAIVAGLIHRSYEAPFELDTLSRFFGLLAATIAATVVSGVAGTMGFAWFHQAAASLPVIWFHWVASDALGTLTVAPLIIGLASMIRNAPSTREAAESALALAVVCVLCAFVVFLPNEPWTLELATISLFPLFVWIAARLPPGVASAATFICAITIVSTTTFDIGMFGGSRLPFEQRVLTAQAAILAVSFGALTLTALFSERRLQGTSLRRREEELQEALRAGGVVAFEWDLRADQVRYSRNAVPLLGLGAELVRASGMLERVHPDDRRQLVAGRRGVDRDHPSFSVTFRYRRGQGDNEAWGWLQQVANAEFDSDGSPSPTHFRGLMTDITQRKRFEEEISRVQKQVERANHAKSVFLAAASHDIRQPLQTLKLLHGELQEQPLNGEGREIASGIGHSIDTMSSMLSSLLDINRLESGDLRPSKSDFAVNEIFDSVAKDLLRPLQQKGLQWRVVPTDLVVRSDRRMLEEMIRNLLSNAIRYTDRGKILLGCRRAGETVRIEVWDTGIGIPGDELPHIFEEHHRDAERGGFGLGLAIVRRLAEILGHQVDVRSAMGKGTGFSIEVPRGSARAGVPEPVRAAEAGGDAFRGTVLIIEDETSVRAALSRMLKSLGLAVIGAATVVDAIELIRQPGPDIVICDYNLPGPMNGIESIKSLRASLGRDVPAIIMTGDTRSNTLVAIASFGVPVLVKPFSADELLQLINRAAPSAATSFGSECRRTRYT